MNNDALMKSAREALKGKWTLAVLTYLVYIIIAGISGAFGWGLLGLVIGGPLYLGIAIFSLNIARGKEAKIEQIFDGFQRFSTSFIAYILMFIFIFLWMLLLIIPGIIAAISYSMTFFIIADDPGISPMDALSKSKKMMDGHKMRFFGLYLIFFLLTLLSALTLFIGLLWLMPFMYVTFAKFYEDIKDGPAAVEAATTSNEPVA